MKLFDSHVHFDNPADLETAIARAAAAGVTDMLAVGGCPRTNRCAITAARKFPDTVRAAIGWDRDQAARRCNAPTAAGFTDLLSAWKLRLTRCRKLGVRIAALGEIGLDYHHAAGSAGAQRRLLRPQLELALSLRLPVVVHTREADNDIVSLLKEHCHAGNYSSGALPGVVHCFTGNLTLARQLLDLDFMLGFSGIVTFRNAANLRQTAAYIPDDRLLIETDSPYLAPEPLRGRRNEPALLPLVLKQLAQVRGCSETHLAAITSRNAVLLFGN